MNNISELKIIKSISKINYKYLVVKMPRKKRIKIKMTSQQKLELKL